MVMKESVETMIAAGNCDKVDGLNVYATTVVQSITPNDWVTVTHNLGTTSQRIFAINGDLSANGFTITGLLYNNTNSFKVFCSGGASGSGRINYVVFY